MVQTPPSQQPQVVVVQKGSAGFNTLMWIIVISIIIIGVIAIFTILFTGACCIGVAASSATLATSTTVLSVVTSG